MLKKLLLGLVAVVTIGTTNIYANTDSAWETVSKFHTEYDVYWGISENMIVITENAKFGIIDIQGNTISLPIWDSVELLKNDIAVISSGNKYGLIDAAGKILVSPIYEKIEYSDENMFLVQKDDKFGFIDKNGNIKIDITWDAAQPFKDKMAFVGIDNKHGFIDPKGNIVIDLQWDYLGTFENGLATCTNIDQNIHGFIDKNGKVTQIDNISDLFSLSEGIAIYTTENSYTGYISTNGEIILPAQEGYLYPFSCGIGIIENNDNTTTFINTKGEVLYSIDATAQKGFVENRSIIRTNNLAYYLMDNNGKLLTIEPWDYLKDYSNGIAVGSRGDDFALIDENGSVAGNKMWQFVDKFEYKDNISNFNYVRENNKCGLLDNNGNLALSLEWDRIIHSNNPNIFLVEKNNEHFLLKYIGKPINTAKNSNIIIQESVSLLFNSIKLPVSSPTLNINDRLFYPFRECFELIDAKITWNETTKTATGTINGNQVSFTMGSNNYIKNGVTHTMDVTPVVYEDRMYIPIRYAYEAVGFNVVWREDFSIVITNK